MQSEEHWTRICNLSESLSAKTEQNYEYENQIEDLLQVKDELEKVTDEKIKLQNEYKDLMSIQVQLKRDVKKQKAKDAIPRKEQAVQTDPI